MIIDCIADLHGHYPNLEGGDLLIVAGDLTKLHSAHEFFDFEEWIDAQSYSKKIIVAGNHDDFLTRNGHYMFASMDYLCDSGTEFEGLRIWGSPWTLTFPGINPHCTAFTGTEAELEAKFAMIPDDTDILVTHGPPKGMLDRSIAGIQCGSQSLTNKIHRLQLRVHVFGHIHEAYGKEDCFIPAYNYIGMCDCRFINCSQVNERYKPVNKPVRVVL